MWFFHSGQNSFYSNILGFIDFFERRLFGSLFLKEVVFSSIFPEEGVWQSFFKGGCFFFNLSRGGCLAVVKWGPMVLHQLARGGAQQCWQRGLIWFQKNLKTGLVLTFQKLFKNICDFSGSQNHLSFLWLTLTDYDYLSLYYLPECRIIGTYMAWHYYCKNLTLTEHDTGLPLDEQPGLLRVDGPRMWHQVSFLRKWT